MSAFARYRAGILVYCWVLGSLAGSSLGWAQTPTSKTPAQRLAPGASRLRAGQVLRVRVTDAAVFRQWLALHHPQTTLTPEPGLAGVLRVQGPTAAQLAACPVVSFVEPAQRVAQPERQLNGADLTVNTVTAVHARYPALTGQGLTVSVKESPLDVNDIDFKGRLVQPDPQAQPLNSHATIMATLIAGGGNSALNGKGAAWQARIAQASYDNLLPDATATLAAQGVSVQNHSYGVSVENFYGLEAQAYDEQVRQQPALLHVFSAGNSGTQPAPDGPYAGLAGVANLTGQFKNSKNSLSVGATDALGQVGPLSSRGPAADGRLKPELVAYGDGGTSDAAALVSGISLLVQDAYRSQRGALPPASLVKAVLLNAAEDTGRPGPDYATGYGQADALGAVETVLARRYAEAAVAQGQEQVISLTVPAGVQHLKVTLAWTDPAASPGGAATLVNDLDLMLVRPTDGQRWEPWTLSAYPHLDSLALPARRRPNHRDNTEQITLDLPAPGTYELRVRGHQVPQGPQAFSLAYELGSGVAWTYPGGERNVRPGEQTFLRWTWAGPATPARLEYLPVGAPAVTLSASLDLRQERFAWAAPAGVTLAQVRLLTGGGPVVSDTFFVARPLAMRVEYACPEETLLAWPRVPGATAYRVYVLGATHLQAFRTVADTALLLTPAEAAARYFAVAPIVGGHARERGSTVDVTQETHGCYVRSFLPRQLVTDSIRFDFSLGTTYNVARLLLERRRPDGTFEPVQQVQPVTRTGWLLTDPTPEPGRLEYRVQVQLTNGRRVYSAVEEVYYLRNAADILVYPVPAPAGEPLTLVGPRDQPLRVRVLDMTGRLQRDVTTDVRTIQSLDTQGLKPGTYLLRISTPGGREVTRRITLL